MDKSQEARLQELVDTYNVSEKKIQQLKKEAVGVREQFKQIYRQQIAEEQHIQYVTMKEIDEMLGKKKVEE